MCIVLAWEAREGPNTQGQAGRFMAETGHHLEDVTARYHQLGIGGPYDSYGEEYGVDFTARPQQCDHDSRRCGYTFWQPSELCRVHGSPDNSLARQSDPLLLHSQEDLRNIHLLRVSPVQCAPREVLRKQALIFRPAMMLCGASAYPLRQWAAQRKYVRDQSRGGATRPVHTYTHTSHAQTPMMASTRANQLFGVAALAHRGLPPCRGFVREVPLAFPAPHLHAFGLWASLRYLVQVDR